MVFSSAPKSIEVLGSACLVLGFIHSFLVSGVRALGDRFKKRSFAYRTLHLLGEIEFVFAFWAFIFVILALFIRDARVGSYIGSLSFDEVVFLPIILILACTEPVLELASSLLLGVGDWIARNLGFSKKPLQRHSVRFFVLMVAGPVLGSLITEPAAMAVTARLLRREYFSSDRSLKFKYAAIALLFINISIGGTLTHFAAPPVLMVAKAWGWTSSFMFLHFGWKALVSSAVLVCIFLLRFKKEFKQLPSSFSIRDPRSSLGSMMVHLALMGLVIKCIHHPWINLEILLLYIAYRFFFEGDVRRLQIKDGLLVGLFLGGIVILGGQQAWWLKAVLASLNDLGIFVGATLLTGVVDNAALTFLGSQVPDLGESTKIVLMSGAVIGGGLTLVANAPNPAGYQILKDSFGAKGFQPLRLLVHAILPTTIVALLFWFL
jgi:hypothetical protein